jgi:hypothetical protein
MEKEFYVIHEGVKVTDYDLEEIYNYNDSNSYNKTKKNNIIKAGGKVIELTEDEYKDYFLTCQKFHEWIRRIKIAL